MESVDKIFEDLFELFAFGVRRKDSGSMAVILWAINVALPLAIILTYSLSDNIFVSYDALSKITDVIQLFGPLFVHFSIITIFLIYYKVHVEIHEKMEKINKLLMSYKNEELYKKIQIKRNAIFVLKVLIVKFIGIGIEIFLIVS